MLGRHIRRYVWISLQAGRRRNENDTARRTFNHAWQRRPNRQKGSGEIYLNSLLPIRERRFGGWGAACHAGIGDHNIEWPSLLLGCLIKLGHRVLVRHICRYGKNPVACNSHGIKRRLPPPADRHVNSRSRERSGDRSPDARSAARHKCMPAGNHGYTFPVMVSVRSASR